jgi:exodeoxyribonuclease-3
VSVLRVITLNVNGLRAATSKGLTAWLRRQRADIICLQEIRCCEGHIDDTMRLNGYHHFFAHAQRKGYSGVAIYSRQKPKRVIRTLGWSVADDEGRYIQLDFTNLSVASIYFPSGSHREDRQQEKMHFLAHYEQVLQEQRASGQPFIVCGDWNIAHREIDLKNWRGNKKNSGFLPEERAWLDKVFGSLGWVDAFRVVNDAPDQYTWWSNRGKAWDNNVGWRIDYQVISSALQERVMAAKIYKQKRFSDHAPLIMDYSYPAPSDA